MSAQTRNPKCIAPKAIIDGLTVIGDRRRRESLAKAVARFFSCEPIDGAGQNFASVLDCLVGYDGSPTTFNAYRREPERFLHWSWHVRQQSVLRLNREDIVEFIRFTLNPPQAWIGVKNVARFISRDGERVSNLSWRPFVVTVSKAEFRSGVRPDPKQYKPSQAAVRAAFAVLYSF